MGKIKFGMTFKNPIKSRYSGILGQLEQGLA
jgi:hypothetical protein